MQIANINVDSTFNCGQCFRWEAVPNTESKKNKAIRYNGWAGSRYATVTQKKDGILLSGISKDDIPFWERYFCVDEDYAKIIAVLSQDPFLKKACEFSPGIRILHQEPFETLISFIISQNNNIMRITNIIKELCSRFGDNNAFPDADVLSALSIDDLMSIGTGYRAKYILDAAKKINSGEIRLDELDNLTYNIIDTIKPELLKILGVGPKVCECVMLFGFHQMSAFPRDVWIKRVLEKYYPNGLPECTKGCEGIAQQFLYEYIRNHKQ